MAGVKGKDFLDRPAVLLALWVCEGFTNKTTKGSTLGKLFVGQKWVSQKPLVRGEMNQNRGPKGFLFDP